MLHFVIVGASADDRVPIPDELDDEPPLPPLERGPHDGGDDGEDRFQNKNPSIDQLETMDMHDELTDISNPRILPALTKASESRFRDRISWRFFKQHDFASICDVVDTVEAMSMDVWYAGIASDCTRRMEGVPGQMAGHHQRFQFIWPVAFSTVTHIRWIERHVVKRFKEENRNVRCKNASRGGERISTPFNEIFFYIAASDKLGIDGLDN